MRKRLGLIFCLLMTSIFGLVGCNDDPYASLHISGVNDIDSGVNKLYIEQVLDDVTGNTTYKYASVDFSVKVTGASGDISDNVVVYGGDGYITTPKVTYLGGGVSKITASTLPIDEVNCGQFTLDIRTVEGNKSLKLDFSVDVKLTSFELNQDALKAVTNDYSIVLDDIEDFVLPNPEKSNQLEFEYSIATPSGDTFSIDDWNDDLKFDFEDSSAFYDYIDKGYRYADVVEVSGKQTLKVYPYWQNSKGELLLDNDNNPIPTTFPQLPEEVIDGKSVVNDYVILRVHSLSSNDVRDQYVKVRVVPSAGDVVLSMNTSSDISDSIAINADKDGIYNVVLLNNIELQGESNAYFYERRLYFYVQDPHNSQVGLGEYVVIKGESDENYPVSITSITNTTANEFLINSKKEGTGVYTFIMKNTEFPGLFDKEIKVRFKVMEVPSIGEISIEGSNPATIYDVYPRNSFGTRFTVNTQKSDFGYSLVIDVEDKEDLGDKLIVKRNGDGEICTLGVKNVDTITSINTSSITTFASKSTFYLSHSMATPLDRSVKLYVAISFTVADKSYTSDIIEEYFSKQNYIFIPITLNFEKGVGEINTAREDYQINLSNTNYIYDVDKDGNVVNPLEGFKLLDLPAGRTVANTISGITYNESIIKVYECYDEESCVTSLYFKGISGASADQSTEVVITTNNGQVARADISTYIPTIYAEGREDMPLSCMVNESSSAFLYYMTGKDVDNHKSMYQLYNGNEEVKDGEYTSIATLFMIVNQEQAINFYDYRITQDDDGYYFAHKINITSKVRVTFSNSEYASYSGGVIHTKGLVTMDHKDPIIMTVTYSTGYEDFDENGDSIFVPTTITHTIRVYIYVPLEGVEITSSKDVGLYIDDSLGYYNKDLSKHTIVSTFIPKKVELGSQWNDNTEEWGENQDFQPVQLSYEYQSALESSILNSSKQEIKISSTEGNEPWVLKYKDLFSIVEEGETYECYVHCAISSDLSAWLKKNGYNTPESIDGELKNIFKDNIEFVIYVNIRQFNKIVNINSVRFTVHYAERIEKLKLDLDDDGVYFEIRDGKNSESADVKYTINSADVVNKNISLFKGDLAFYGTEVVSNATGNSGTITITPIRAGVGYLKVTPQDNIKDKDNNFYNDSSNLVQTFRIKVADGSSDYPFEIRTIEDYMQMREDIENKKYYHYVITRDLNLEGYDINSINIVDNSPSSSFVLTGKHTYDRNGETITTYSTIYNLHIERSVNNLSKDTAIGLFGEIGNFVKLDNIYISNARISIYDNNNTDKTMYIGLLAGKSKGTISSCSVAGTINITRNQSNSNIVVGGMVGSVEPLSVVSGLPGNYADGIVTSGNNSYVSIYLSKGKATTQDMSKNILGGLVGQVVNAEVTDVQVASSITSELRSIVGGVIGLVKRDDGKEKENSISNVFVVPSIVVNIADADNEEDNSVDVSVGGVIGMATYGHTLTGVIVNFLDISSSTTLAGQHTNIWVTTADNNIANVGGMIGSATQSGVVSASYVRSFYSKDIEKDSYYGNIFVNASNGNVGGLIGCGYAGSTLSYAYLDGDMVVDCDLNAGMLMGNITKSQNASCMIRNVYAIGQLYTYSFDGENEILNRVNTIGGNLGLIGGNSSVSISSDKGNDIFGENVSSYESSGFGGFQTYAVINGNIKYFATGTTVYAIKSESDETPKVWTNSVSLLDVLKNLGYQITKGKDQNLSAFQWFYNDKINTVTLGDDTLAYPVLLYEGKVLYDLVPTEINVIINEKDGLYNISYKKTQQVIMFLNKYTSGSNDKTYYELALDKSTASFQIRLDGTTISTTYINSSNLKLYNKIEVLESSSGSVIKIDGSKIIPVSTGSAVLTIRSYAVNSVKVDINIIVVHGITDIVTNLSKVDENVVHIDEQSRVAVSAINKSEDYIANSNYGFILELLDADNNGTIQIGNKSYTYDSVNRENNILIFNAVDFLVSGVKLGNLKFTITPYIILDGVEYVDTYVSQDGQFNKEISGVYIVRHSERDEESGNLVFNQLHEEYILAIRAKATDISNSSTSIELTTAGDVDFGTNITTANVSIVESIVDGKTIYTTTIYEDLYIKFNGEEYELSLDGKSFVCELIDGKYVCKGSSFTDVIFDYDKVFKYSLINLIFNKLTIEKVSSNTLKDNTYILGLSGTIRFDSEEYRKNADQYDLSLATFRMELVPSSNEKVSAETLIKIAPNELTSIYTNFYSKIDRSNNIYNEYPESNESEFIVPGREGLLKVTLDSEIDNGEFNNSSYIVVTLDKKYEGLVTLQQLSAIVENVNENYTGDIIGYKNVISSEDVTGNGYFGIKLSKLSINYNDKNYFNNTYYIKIYARTTITESTLDLNIVSYVRQDNEYYKQLTKESSLQIMELPSIEASVNGDTDTVMGRGVRKELTLKTKGIASNIDFNITGDDNLTITDDSYQEVVELDIDYIRSGRKYYLNQDISAVSGTNYSIEFTARETILGIIEESNCVLSITTVDFELSRVTVCERGHNESIILKFGENIPFDVEIEYRDIVVGDKDTIADYKSGDLKKLLTLAQYEFAGIKYTEYSGGVETILSSGNLNLYIRDNSITDYVEYQRILGEGSYGGISLIKEVVKSDDGSIKEYYELLGSEISDDNYLQLDVNYYFDKSGKLCLGDGDLSAIYANNYTMNFTVVVEDNSTYDHPTPVEDAEKLKSISGVEGGNFILVNNIVLEDWAPVEAKFASLDGNGYSITIKSFDLSAFRGVSSADVGIFSTVSENTLIKNIIVDVKELLVSGTTMQNNVFIMKASSQNTYKYNNGKIDLGYIEELNFGIVAGTNNGSITNAKIVSTKVPTDSTKDGNEYLHVLTTQGEIDGSTVESNIGGIAGVNGSTGAITNSFVGVNISNSKTVETTSYYIETIASPSATKLHNSSDELEKVQVYPFILAGGNNLGGMVAINNGVISNSYAKGLGIYNTNPTGDRSTSAGLVAYNNNLISSAFVEGSEISEFRALDNRFRLESTGNIGGLVYENNSTIENSYSNAYIKNNSSYIGGFVYRNTSTGIISNSYSTAVNGNSNAIGQFTGVKQNTLQNSGIYNNCYYLVGDGELSSPIEDAVEIVNSSNPFDSATSWSGFSFVTGANVDGIWLAEEGNTPRIASTLTDTVSFRKITDSNTTEEEGIVYDYRYNTYYLGSKENPLIIEKAENFDLYIIDNIEEINGEKVFGYKTSSRYIRLVNNLDFADVVFANGYNGTSLYSVTFAGVLDGNGMKLSNLNLNTKIDSKALENFGLFGKVGYIGNTSKAVVKNLNISVNSFSAKGNNKTGILAGTIENASIVNVKIDGGSTVSDDNVVSGSNMAGALAGLIYADSTSSISIIDVEISNVKVKSSYTEFSGAISEPSNSLYTQFKIIKNGQQTSNGFTFASLYDSNKTASNVSLDKVKTVSYAGGVAGAVIANNYATEVGTVGTYETYRTKSNESTISNVIVKDGLNVDAEYNAGGLFGYIGENTLIRNSSLIVSDGQLLKGGNYVGGIVGENHGIIEQCTVSYTTDVSQDTNQSVYDSTILSNDRNNGTYDLFNMSSGADYFTVAIGGIAGYSENGVILDSYSKVNVVKPLSFIAGGIVGYSNGYNYISYVYNTGTVYGRDAIGGTIGMQVGAMYMTNVVSLTNWNASSDNLNIRDEITKKLYKNQSILYSGNSFYIKMPEVGNAPIFDIDNKSNSEYSTAVKSAYIGSVVGKAFVVGDDQTTIKNMLTDANIETLYGDTISGVFSATLGIVNTTGSIASGNRVDDYFKTSFTVDGGDDNKITSLSYRVAYANNTSGLNGYSLGSTDNKYIDNYSFKKIFTSQEYIQQLLGVSYQIKDVSEDDTGDKTTKTPLNIFLFGYDDTASVDRFKISTENSNPGKFTDLNAGIWEVSSDTDEDYYYLPMYDTGVIRSRVEVETADQLKSAFSNSTTGKTYVIMNNITLDFSSSENIQYHGGIKSLFVGQKSGDVNPKITIWAKTAVFDLFNGAVFQDIDFLIVAAPLKYDTTGSESVDSENFGYLANTLDGVQITNCNFDIVLSGYGDGAHYVASIYPSENFKATTIGVLFGAVNNSTIKNSNFKVSTDKVWLYKSIDTFGLFAGDISRSTFDSVEFTFSCQEIESMLSNLSLGAISGGVYNSKFSDIRILTGSYHYLSVGCGCEDANMSIGGLFGSANQLNMENITGFRGYDNESRTYGFMGVEYFQGEMLINNGGDVETCDTLNIGLIVGESTASKISGVEISSDVELNVSGGTINTYNVGSIIGKDNGNSQIGKSSVVGSYATVNSTIKANRLSAGGLVGYTAGSLSLMSNAFYDGEMNITNNNVSTYTETITDSKGATITKEYSPYTYVGGLLGYSEGKVGLSSVVSGANINLNIANDKETNDEDNNVKILASLGGIIGGINSTTTIDTFASFGTLTLNKTNYNQDIYATYMSGVVGQNNGVLKATNGYSYVQLPLNTQTICLSIADGALSGTRDVYYAQEFMGNSYESDIAFGSYAMADLYGSVSEYSSIYALKDAMTVDKIGSMALYIPSSLSGKFVRNGSSDKFHPNVIKSLSNNATIGDNTFNVITDGINNCGTNVVIGSGAILSGKSISTGKVVLGFAENKTNITPLFASNAGILSDVYVNLGDNTTSNAYTLMGINNGTITNVMVYGVTKANYAFASTNNGYIYASISSIKYSPSKNADNTVNPLYGFVLSNNGTICDCYSSSFAYVDSGVTFVTNVYGFANENNGTIENSAYYVNSAMLHDSKIAGFVASEKENSNISNCFNSSNSSVLLQRSNVWYLEDGHNQIVGMKDVGDNIITKINITVDGKITYCDSVLGLYDAINKVISEKKEYTLSYTYEFYTKADNKPKYNVVRICTADELIDYIASLNNGYIPANTIVLITNDFANESSSNIIDMAGRSLNRISLNSTSALIGINTSGSDNMKLDFGNYNEKGVLESKTTIYHEFINENKGLIVGLDIANVVFAQTSASLTFAPIYSNSGIISNTRFEDISVVAVNGTEYVAGVVTYCETGILHNSGAYNSISISTSRKYNITCTYVGVYDKDRFNIIEPTQSSIAGGMLYSKGK